MAANDTSASQDQQSDSAIYTLGNKDVSTIVQTSRGDGNKSSTTGNGKTSKNQKSEVNGEMKTNKTNNITRHAPKLPTRTNKTKKRSAGTTTTITTTTETSSKTSSTNGLPTTQPSSSSSSRPAVPVITHHHRALNPLLLARGMSSRYLSTKIISASSTKTQAAATTTNTSAVAPTTTTTTTSILPLSKTEIEKDLRHMEAYRAASIGYGQQLFVYKNQDLVRSGYFGSFFVGPGVLGDGSDGEHTIVGGDGMIYHPAAFMVEDDTVDGRAPYNEDDGQDEENENDMSLLHRLPNRPGGGKRGPSSHRQQSQQQHNNRGRPYLPIKIDPEEEKRLSGLRKRMHQSEFVRMQLETQYLSLRSHYVHESQLVRKTRSYEMEGRLKLMREVMVRREKVLALMRVKMAIWRDVEVKLMGYRDGWYVGGTENDTVIKTAKDSGSDPTGEKVEVEEGVANDDSKQVDLLKIWNDISSQLKAAEAACMELETPEVLTQMVVTPTPTTPSSSSASSATSIAKNGRKRSGSVTSTEELANNTNDSSSGKRRVTSTTGLEPHIIPWDCMVEPQTPYEFPLLLSCLSSATDKVAGYVTDRTNPSAITWLESTLPRTTSAYNNDAEDLKKLQEEVRALEDELQCECVRNTELREEINASRTRSDEMVALMQLLRSETEAVLERHNVIMETPEARAKAAELHQRRIEEENLKNPLVEGEEEEEEEDDDEEGEVDENEEFSSGEEEINRYEQESDDELYDSVGIKEITVDKDSNNEAGESDEDDEDGSEGGDVAVDDDAEEEEPRARNKRRGQEDEDEMSNSVSTPPNSSSYRKRRRY